MSQDFKTRLFQFHLGQLTALSKSSENRRPGDSDLPLFANIVIDGSNPSMDHNARPSFTITGDGVGENEENSLINADSYDQLQRTRFPGNIEECFETTQAKRLLYLSFRALLMTCNETLEGMVLALKDTIPRGCEWFIDSWGAHALNANEDLIVRAKIFSCLRKLFGIISAAHPPPSNRDILKDILERAISMETMSHVICTLFLDVDNQFSDSDLLDWAWRTQHFREDDYFVTSYADSTLEKVTSATFNHPHLYSEERLTRVINNLSSSLDVLKLILGDLVLYATQYHNLKSSQQTSLSQDKKETRTNDEAQRSAYLKVEWFIQFLNKNPLKLTVLNARAALDTCSRVNMFLDPSTENENWQRLLNDFVGKMQSVILKSKLSNSHPALLCDAIPPSNIIQLLAEKRGQIMERDDPKITFMGSVRSLTNPGADISISIEPVNILAALEDIRFQVDPAPERIVLKPMGGALEAKSEEILVSSTSGTLVVTRKETIWSSANLDFTNPSGFSYSRESTFNIRHTAIARFSAVPLRQDAKQAQQHQRSMSTRDPSSLEALQQNENRQASAMGNLIVKSSNLLAKSAEASRMLFSGLLQRNEKKSAACDRKPFAIVIHTRNEAFKFYPFYDDEATQMLKVLTAVTGLVPFKGSEFVQSVLTKRVELTRRQALRQLLQEPNPWIDNNVDLTRIIEALISDVKPQLIIDMERLFHSCKLEGEVTKEATAMLRKLWHHTPSDQSRMKILSVIDRLLDRVIMRQEDAVFTTVFKWLKHLEETINPYRNPEMLKLVLYLVKRAKMIQIEPLAPLPHDQREGMFDYYEEYQKVMQFAEEFGVKLHLANE